MRVLVFGGTGWVGHHIVLKMVAAGHKVTVCTRGKKSAFLDEIPGGIEFITGDKSNEEFMKELLAQGRWDAIADSVPSVVSIDLIAKYAKNINCYLHCSSTGGYAPLPFVPCDETAPYLGFNGTGWLPKKHCDELAMSHFMKTGFPAVILRPTYITGKGLYPLDNFGDRRHDFVTDLAKGNTVIVPNDGTALLHPVHVEDLAECFRLAAENRSAVGQIFNICLDKALPFNRYLEVSASVFGKKPVIEYMPVEEILKNCKVESETGLRFAASHMCFTNEKARRILGYRPSRTTETAVRENILWAAEQEKI